MLFETRETNRVKQFDDYSALWGCVLRGKLGARTVAYPGSISSSFVSWRRRLAKNYIWIGCVWLWASIPGAVGHNSCVAACDADTEGDTSPTCPPNVNINADLPPKFISENESRSSPPRCHQKPYSGPVDTLSFLYSHCFSSLLQRFNQNIVIRWDADNKVPVSISSYSLHLVSCQFSAFQLCSPNTLFWFL